ncbi:hypothetical protein [Devosia sp.]|uniref:hypothetical protein n=1 Tax=Devosia sp. TaxID=1871048 RepID=UPI002FCB413F
MDDDASLRADCGRCAGLCCVALAFDRSALFAEGKAAGQACRHLGPADRCAIHADRVRSGYAGCVRYDCLGAGQLVTQELFGGRSWRECADGGKAMFTAFAQARRVQEWRQLLASAAQLQLTRALALRRAELQGRLRPQRGWTLAALAGVTNGSMSREMAEFLRELRIVARPQP